MRTWRRAPLDVFCGRCNGLIQRDEPECLFQTAGSRIVKVRCRGCADEPVPADLPAAFVRAPGLVPPPVNLTRLRQVFGLLPLEGAERIHGNPLREPGEEG